MMKNTLLIMLGILLLTSCIEEVVYEKVQPEGIKNEKRFNSKFRGKYYDNETCFTIEIKKKSIIERLHIETTIHKTKVPSFKLELSNENNSTLDYKLIEKGDSVLVKLDHKETIFAIGKDQKLRYYDGVYFLNYKDTNKLETNQNLWNVKILSLKDDKLIMGKLPAEEDYLENLKTIFPLSPIKDKDDETIGYKTSPSQNNWSQFINEEAYSIYKEYSKKKTNKKCSELVVDF